MSLSLIADLAATQPLTRTRKTLFDTALVFRRSLAQAKRAPVFAIVFPIMFPILLIALMSQLYGDMAEIPGFPTDNVTAWMAPGVFLMSAMFGAGYSATGLVTDIQTGYLDRLRMLPVSPRAILLGRVAFDIVRVAVAGLVVLGVSIALGGEVTAAGIPVMLGLLALWTLAYSGLFYAVGLRSKNPESLSALIPLFMPIAFLSTAFVPTDVMPVWIDAIATVNPYTYVVEGVRMFMTEPFSWGGLALAGIAAGGVALVTHRAAGRSFTTLANAD